MTEASARIVAAVRAHTVCVVLSSVCATAVDNSSVYVYYLKRIVSVCFRCPVRTVGFSGTRLNLSVMTCHSLERIQADHMPVRELCRIKKIKFLTNGIDADLLIDTRASCNTIASHR